MDNNKCIRVLADINQIKECRDTISEIEGDLQKYSRVLNLAGNEVRLKILFLLYKEDKMCPCDLSDVLNMKVPAISQHLRKLKDAGIIISKKVGQTIFYSISCEESMILLPILDQFMKGIGSEAVKPVKEG